MNDRSRELEERMFDAAEILARRVEHARTADPDHTKLVNDVLKAAATFAEQYRAYCEHLTRGAMGE